MPPNANKQFNMDVTWLNDMPFGGDLARYREQASFNWKHLRVVLEDPDKLRFKVVNQKIRY